MTGVTARIASRKIAIWNQPLAVIATSDISCPMFEDSKSLRFQQRVRQVHEQPRRHDQADDGIDGHDFFPSRSQPRTYAVATTKKRTVTATNRRSIMAWLSMRARMSGSTARRPSAG